MATKEDKALQYAKEAWGVYFDDKHPDIAIEFTQGQITQTDYLNGYNQAIKDSCNHEMLEMLQKIKLVFDMFVMPTEQDLKNYSKEIGVLIQKTKT